jgi:dolichol-phosphate mannosyltransferase
VPRSRTLRVAAVIPAFDEESRIARVVSRVPRSTVERVIVVDDGSTDGTAARAEDAGAEVVRLGRTVGVGAALREGFRRAVRANAEVVVVLAGNDKDAPEEIPRLLEMIRNGFDVVQGSRYLPGGRGGNMPFYRRVATRLHARLFSLVAGRRFTDTTNGFRAIRRVVLDDHRMGLDAKWLDEYELEPFLLLRAVRLGYRVGEAPVTKIYPRDGAPYTKMAPITGWWSILRPLVRAALRSPRSN